MSIFSLAQEKHEAKDEHEAIFHAIENNDLEGALNALSENILNAQKQHIHVLENVMKDGWMGIAKFVYRYN